MNSKQIWKNAFYWPLTLKIKLNLLLNFFREEPTHMAPLEKFLDKLHSMLAADLTDQIQPIPVVATPPTQVNHTVQEGCGSILTIFRRPWVKFNKRNRLKLRHYFDM